MAQALRSAHRDWVLLKVEGDRFQAAPTVHAWASEWQTTICRVLGYPGGRRAFKERGVVESVASNEIEVQVAPGDGLIKLTGDASRAGMSGGGIFTSSGEFLGLHRARRTPS